MIRRLIITLGVVLSASTVGAQDRNPPPGQPSHARERPNVVVLLVDDLGWQDIGCYGGPVKTPTLDRLAAQGVRFTDFHSACGVCSPSRATTLTGRHHIRAGVYHVINDRQHEMHLLRREVTLAEVLKGHGYDTVHLGKWHMGLPVPGKDKPTPYDHGFDYWFGTENTAAPSHKDPVNFHRHGKPLGRIEGYACQIVVDEAIAWLEKEREPDNPFFLNIWFHEPHAPIAAPDEIVSQYGNLDDPAAIYSGTIDNTDRAIARLVRKLREVDSSHSTLIIFSSDNGSYRAERNGRLRQSKGSNFEGGIRVPGIFCWPGTIHSGRVEDEPAGMVDLLPTVCGLVGVDNPEGVHLDGSDLTPLLKVAVRAAKQPRGKSSFAPRTNANQPSTLVRGTSDDNRFSQSRSAKEDLVFPERTARFHRHQPLFFLLPTSSPAATIRDGKFALVAYRDYELPTDFKAMQGLMKQVEAILKKENSPQLRDGDLWSKMFNSKFANQEAERLRMQVLRLNQFQESWIPAIKSGGYKKFELYDLDKDIAQKTDVAEQCPEVVNRLKVQLIDITASVMADGPDWHLAQAHANPPDRQSGHSTDKALLSRIDRTDLPEEYLPAEHQPYVDRRMAELSNEQRGQIGQLWREKQRLDPNMPNRGFSFVKILQYVAESEDSERHVGDNERTTKASIKSCNTSNKAASVATASSARKLPNVVVLLADDLGWQDIGCYGGPVKTSAIDRLAAGGVRFTDFHSGAAVCSPSRATLLTGRQHLRAGIYSWIHPEQKSHLLGREVTLAEVLRGHGYETVHLGKWHLGMPSHNRNKPTPSEHGFDYWFATANNAHPSHRNPVNLVRNGAPVAKTDGYACQVVVDEAIAWLDQKHDPKKPFFLNVWFHEPHAPLAAPDALVTRYGELNDPAAIYSATIENTDRAIDRLLKKLKQVDTPENTLIIYSSDNGSYRADRVGHLRSTKGSNYEGGIRVPGIFAWPGKIPSGQIEDEPAGQVDLLPTVCGLLGIETPRGVHLDGSDLSPLLQIAFRSAKGRSGTSSFAPRTNDSQPDTLVRGANDDNRSVHRLSANGADADAVFTRHQPLFWLLPASGPAVAIRDGRYTLVAHRSYEFPKDKETMARLRKQIEETLRRNGTLEEEIHGSTLDKQMFEGFKDKEAERLRGQFIRLNMFNESWIPSIRSGTYGRYELFDMDQDSGQTKDVSKQHPDIVRRLKKQLLEINASVMADAPDWSAEASGTR